MKEPKKIRPRGLADYLEVMTRAVFQAGMHWGVIDAKWPGFREAFYNFDPEKVASFDLNDVDALAADTRVVRNRAKLGATVANAQTLLRLENSGGFKRWLRHYDDYDATVKALKNEFRYVGDTSAYYFLWVVNEPVPDFDAWAKSRGITPKTPSGAKSAKR
jgi:3-methyladenine DNA glycosylase Tag